MTYVSQEFIDVLRQRYRDARRTERIAILDVFVEATGCNRKYAIAVLTGKRRQKKGSTQRPRKSAYGEEEVQALLLLSDLFDGICSKRLRSALDIELPRLYFGGEISMSPRCYKNMMKISPATIDRLLVGRRAQLVKSRGHTKPGTLLKHQIPTRTWAEWTESRPGFVEMDLVDHSGGRIIPGTDHAWTLCFTDVHTGWTECVAVRNKAQVHVFDAIKRARERLPFPLLGVDSDNGSEFINDQLVRYCNAEQITFTRGRVRRRNDSCYVEQKNWSVVRRVAGYSRYDTPEQLTLLNRVYLCIHYHGNFFLPVMKLASKARVGSKVARTYDGPQTPFARVLASADVSAEHKDQLRETYALISLLDLRQQITSLQDALLHTLSIL